MSLSLVCWGNQAFASRRHPSIANWLYCLVFSHAVQELLNCSQMCEGKEYAVSFPRCFFRCMFGCFLRCCMQPQDIHQGGGHVVALTVGEKGESHGLFFVKGDMKQPSPQCMDKKNQINMLKVIRDYTQDQRSWCLSFLTFFSKLFDIFKDFERWDIIYCEKSTNWIIIILFLFTSCRQHPVWQQVRIEV